MTQTDSIDYENLSKLEKLAYLFVALGPDVSAPLLKRMDDDIVEKICKHMSEIQVLPSDIKKKIIKEFSLMLSKKIGDTINDEEQVKKLLSLAQGEDKAKATWDHALQDPILSQVAQWFESTETIKLFDAIKNEQMQTIAFIFSCMPSKKATELLALFPQEQQESILVSLGTMQSIPVERMAEILQTLQGLTTAEAVKTATPQTTAIEGGPASVANLLNSLKKDQKKGLLENLEKKNTDLVKSIQKYLFTFEDLLTLKKEDVQKIIREIDTNDLVLALKGASKELMDLILKSMSKRAAESLKEELENLGPVKVKDVEAARDKVVAVVRQLESSGQLVLGDGEDELMLP
ncbi:MAG: flagellar motor switch protein FliG [bacterium]